MNESAIEFGPGQEISAILTEPEHRVSDVAVVIVNAGLVHRVGPFRLHVILARELARSGFLAVRMDVSGLGYSKTRKHRCWPIC